MAPWIVAQIQGGKMALVAGLPAHFSNAGDAWRDQARRSLAISDRLLGSPSSGAAKPLASATCGIACAAMPIIDAIGTGGLPCLDLRNAHGHARIYLHGAHVTAWTPTDGSEVLWLSTRSHFAAGKPIRGGIPICFPWFGGHPTNAKLPAHGFARSLPWLVQARTDRADGSTQVILALADDADTRAQWPHPFRAELTLTLAKTLDIALTVTNTGSSDCSYEQALHSYFAVSDIEKTTVDGCQGRKYFDKAGGGMVERTDDQPAITFRSETDRVYPQTPGPHLINDTVSGRKIRVAKRGAATSVIWNPWIAKAAAMADYGDHEWPGMVCVEAANAGADRITLRPGAQATCATTLEWVR